MQRDDATPDEASLDNPHVQQACQRLLVFQGRLPRWAERALRAQPDTRRNDVIVTLLSHSIGWPIPKQVSIARYLRSLGWSGEYKMVAMAEMVRMIEHRRRI